MISNGNGDGKTNHTTGERIPNTRISMSQQAQLLLLREFFSGYFHEDSHCEAESAEAVVSEYVRTTTPSDVRTLSRAILEYSRAFASDRELEEKLFTDPGCYCRPSGQGISAKAWLKATANELLRERQS